MEKTQRRKVTLLLAVVLPFGALAPGCQKRNLDGLCQLAKDILAEPRNAPGDRLPKLLDQRAYYAHGIAGRALDAALAAPAAERYETFLSVATSEVGAWKCSALEAVLDAPEAE